MHDVPYYRTKGKRATASPKNANNKGAVPQAIVVSPASNSENAIADVSPTLSNSADTSVVPSAEELRRLEGEEYERCFTASMRLIEETLF